MDVTIELIEQLIEAGLYDNAIKYVERLLQENDAPALRFLKGYALYMSGRFNEAIEELTKVIVEDKKNWKAYLLLGEIYYSQNKLEQALNFLNKATILNPKAEKAWKTRGKIAYQMGDYQTAALCIETYLRLYENDSEYWRLLARCYKTLKNTNAAIDAYNMAIELDSENISLYEELGDYYLELGHAEIAKQKYKQALTVREITIETNKSLYLKLIKIYLKDKEWLAAFNLCNQILVLEKNDPEALFYSGKALIGLGNIKEGKEKIEKAYSINQKEEYAHYLKELDDQLYKRS